MIMKALTIDIGKNDLDSVLKKYTYYEYLIVDFYLDWCPPCKKLEEIFKYFEYKKKLLILKVDINQNQELAKKLKIKNAPEMYFQKLEADKVNKFNSDSVCIKGLRNANEITDILDDL